MALTLQNAVKRIQALEDENKKLTEELQQFKRSPYFLSYVTILKKINGYCKQLIAVDLDIFDGDNKDAFGMQWKFTQELPQLLQDVDALREKMLPAEQREAQKIRDDSMVESFADKWKRD
jgi:hypothetical protein